MASASKKIPPQKNRSGSRRKITNKAVLSSEAPFATNFIKNGFWAEHKLPVVVLLGLPFLLYGASLSFGYLLDDQLVIWGNTYVQKGLTGLWDIFAHDSFMGFYQEENLLLEGGRYRPLSLATFALEVEIFGKNNPGISHFINILLYGLTGLLFYRILIAFFPLKESSKWYFGLPFISALVFLLHPLHTEVVTNIKGRDEIMALMGSLGTLYAIMKYFDTNEWKWAFWSAVIFILALFSKENAVTYLAVIPLALLMFGKVPYRKIFRAMTPLVGVTLLFIFIRFKALGFVISHGQKVEDLMNNPFLEMSAAERYATTFLTLGWYLKLLFVPHPLTHDYYPYHVPKIGWDDWRALTSFLVYLAIGIWALREMLKDRNAAFQQSGEGGRSQILAFSILYFILTLSVVSNLLINVGTFMNERFAYMPSIGFALLTGWFFTQKLPELLKVKPDRPYRFGVATLAIICFLYGWKVWTRVPDWGGDGTELITSAVRNSPNSSRAQYYYGNMLYYKEYLKIQNSTNPDSIAKRKELVREIEKHIDRSLEINPNYRSPMVIKAALAVAKFQEHERLDLLLTEFENIIRKQPYNGEMLTYVCDYTKTIQDANAQQYNSFCHRIGFEFYFKQKHDLNGALEFLNYSLSNRYADGQILQDLIEVYAAMGNQEKVAEMQRLLLSLEQRITPK